MKKVASILAVVVMSIGMFSCEAESTADTDTLYTDVQAAYDGTQNDTDERQ